MKSIFPANILLSTDNTLILPHFNYGILVWGYNVTKIHNLHKRVLRVITAVIEYIANPFLSIMLLKVHYTLYLF